MPARPQIGLITNTGPSCLLPYLRAAGSSCKQIDIAVAFITLSGLESLLHVLQQVARRGQVRVLTGLYQGFTEPKALALLLREQRVTSNRLAVRISDDKRFHWKSYFLLKDRSATAIVGSSNMTAEGLTDLGELNVVLSSHRDAKQFRTVHSAFESYWENKSKPLSTEIVAAYRQWHEQQPATSRPSVPLTKILGKAVKQGTEAHSPRQKRCWQLSWVDTLDDETVDLLAQITDWDKKGFETLCTFTSRIRAGDRAVMFDFHANRMSLVEIMDHVEAPTRTSDGRHFIAYRMRRSTKRKKLTRALWKLLRDRKIVKSRQAAEFIGVISEGRYRACEELLQGK